MYQVSEAGMHLFFYRELIFPFKKFYVFVLSVLFRLTGYKGHHHCYHHCNRIADVKHGGPEKVRKRALLVEKLEVYLSNFTIKPKAERLPCIKGIYEAAQGIRVSRILRRCPCGNACGDYVRGSRFAPETGLCSAIMLAVRVLYSARSVPAQCPLSAL